MHVHKLVYVSNWPQRTSYCMSHLTEKIHKIQILNFFARVSSCIFCNLGLREGFGEGGCWVVIANIILRIALLAALLLAASPCSWCAARVMSRKADVRVDLRVGA